MKELATVLGSPLFQRIGWALLAFLWQGTLVAALVACAGVALPRRKAALRYAVGCGALLLMLAMPVATFLTHPVQPRDCRGASDLCVATGPAAAPAVWSPPRRPASQPSAGSFGRILRRSAGSLTPFLVAGWLLGVFLLSLRFLAGWTAARSLVRRDVSPAPQALLATFSRLRETLRVSRPVLLMQSAALAVPTALGAIRPVILLPLCAAAGLSPEAIEALLAHELAHIRRHDYLINLLQTAVETLLFYHPAVWWVSRWIRRARKLLRRPAVMATGNPRAYARATSGSKKAAATLELSVAANGGSLWRRWRGCCPCPLRRPTRVRLARGSGSRDARHARQRLDLSFATASEAMPSRRGWPAR
jgi:beta-lactamase regulating signal transducer with metallopeptidase domain